MRVRARRGLARLSVYERSWQLVTFDAEIRSLEACENGEIQFADAVRGSRDFCKVQRLRIYNEISLEPQAPHRARACRRRLQATPAFLEFCYGSAGHF